MAMRRVAVEEAFVTPEIMAQWQVVLAGRDVEPGFAKMGETILAQTPANKPLDDRLRLDPPQAPQDRRPGPHLRPPRQDRHGLRPSLAVQLGARDLPAHFGKWNTVFKRYRDWAKADVFKRLFDA